MKNCINRILISLLMIIGIGTSQLLALNYEGIVLEDVDGEDLNLVINHILDNIEIKSPTTLATYDMNKDGVINGLDLNILIDMALGRCVDSREMRRTGLFKIGGVQFRMIKVEGGTMDMGLMGEQTVGDFWIMQTEMTNNLAEAIIPYGGDAWYQSLDDRYYNPITGESFNPVWINNADIRAKVGFWPCNVTNPLDVKKFTNALSTHFRCGFRLPTVEEWIYAARGGKKSKGYKYSGSNDINEVAWYKANANIQDLPDTVVWRDIYWVIYESDGSYGYADYKSYFPNRIHCNMSHKKKANELGLYDMSGNAAEIAVIDKSPYPYDNGKYLMLGGSVRSDENECVPGEAYEPEQCALSYRFRPDPGWKHVYGWDGEYWYPYPCTTTGWQEYLAVGLRLVLTADPQLEASPVVTVESDIVTSKAIEAKMSTNQIGDNKVVNNQNIQP